MSANLFLERIKLINGDLIDRPVDALCTIVPQNLDIQGSVNSLLDTRSGGAFDEFILENVYKPRIGDVYVLPNLGFKAQHVFVGVVPNYRSDVDICDSHVGHVTRKMMDLGRSLFCKSLAFPLLDSGARIQLPKAKRVRLITNSIVERMGENFEYVSICSKDLQVLKAFEQKLESMRVADANQQ